MALAQKAPLLLAAMPADVLPPAGGAGATRPQCPGRFDMPGYGDVHLVPTGWADEKLEPVDVEEGGRLVAHMDARAYFADVCTAGEYDHRQYLALKLLNKSLRYTVDLTGAGCGCNAAFYLTSMRQNTHRSECSDFYCDANHVCGESCAEIDIQEANQFAWHSTLHTATDHSGVGGGYGGGDSWNGPRDWGSEDYGKGARCVDTSKPFEVAVSFPVSRQGELVAMEVVLSQRGSPCPLSVLLDSYSGMDELSQALEEGMTPIVSYWSANDMLWMDGAGIDGRGPCAADDMDACGKSVKFYNFSVRDIEKAWGNSAAAATATAKGSPTAALAATGAGGGTVSFANPPAGVDYARCPAAHHDDCRAMACCQQPGMQCYEKHEWWAACKETCVPGSVEPEDKDSHRTPWSCKAIGKRTPGGPHQTKPIKKTRRPAGSGGSAGEGSGKNASSAADQDGDGNLGEVLIKVSTKDELPILEVGANIVLDIEGQRLNAKLLEESSALDGSSFLLQRFSSPPFGGRLSIGSEGSAAASALFTAVALVVLAVLTGLAASATVSWRRERTSRRHSSPARWELMADRSPGWPGSPGSPGSQPFSPGSPGA